MLLDKNNMLSKNTLTTVHSSQFFLKALCSQIIFAQYHDGTFFFFKGGGGGGGAPQVMLPVVDLITNT